MHIELKKRVKSRWPRAVSLEHKVRKDLKDSFGLGLEGVLKTFVNYVSAKLL